MTTPPTLNQGQKAAADAFFDFLLTDDKEFIISGPAGVGKTFLMSYIIDHTMTHYHKVCELMGIKPKYTEVQMTATTNKAADVLGQSVKHSLVYEPTCSERFQDREAVAFPYP